MKSTTSTADCDSPEDRRVSCISIWKIQDISGRRCNVNDNLMGNSLTFKWLCSVKQAIIMHIPNINFNPLDYFLKYVYTCSLVSISLLLYSKFSADSFPSCVEFS